MATLSLAPRAPLRRALTINVPLTIAGIVFVVAFIGTLIALTLDHQVITGVPAWNKPAKFMLSSAIYAFTFIWLLNFVQGRRRLVQVIAWVTSLGLLIEDGLITMQVLRGTTSHFNDSTPLNAAIFRVMAVTIVCIWVATLLLGILLVRQRMPDAAFAWALRLGVFLSVVGMSVAFFMVTPTAAQLTASKAGGGLPISGAHSVGVADGGPGLPFLGWSTVGGDLRAPHFVGLHSLQLLPLLGWLIATRGPRWLGRSHRLALVWIAGLGDLGLILLLTWQALRAQSIIHPDALTRTALAALIGAVILSAAGVILAAHRSAPTTYSVASQAIE